MKIIINNKAKAYGERSYARAKTQVIIRFRRKNLDDLNISSQTKVLNPLKKIDKWMNLHNDVYVIKN